MVMIWNFCVAAEENAALSTSDYPLFLLFTEVSRDIVKNLRSRVLCTHRPALFARDFVHECQLLYGGRDDLYASFLHQIYIFLVANPGFFCNVDTLFLESVDDDFFRLFVESVPCFFADDKIQGEEKILVFDITSNLASASARAR